jgi:cytochrome c
MKAIKLRLSLICLLCLFPSIHYANELNDLLVTADIERGSKVSITCQACHSLGKGEPAKIGPNLFGVLGRDIASKKDYNYSAAFTEQKGNWSFEKLDQFIQNPSQMIPGTAMTFPGIKSKADRAAIIAWLRLQSDNPIALPPSSFKGETAPIALTNEEEPDLALLPKGKGRDVVFYTCSVCHSIKLVAQQGLDRYRWGKTLEWMVEEQGMDRLDEENQQLVLDYLSEYFGIDR